jgi:hypothetical protein
MTKKLQKEYVNLINKFKNKGYDFKTFDKYKNSSSVILRHDIDFSLDSALTLAKWNSQEEITATFFFMVSSFSYNLMQNEEKDKVNAIKELNQRISLHFDPTAYKDLKKGFSIEKSLFEALFNEKIEVFSVHRPGDFLKNPNITLDFCKNTYDHKFQKKMKYFSDSGGEFKYGEPWNSKEFNENKNIQLLIHPIWWTTEGKNPTEKLNNWINDKKEDVKLNTSKNCKSYIPHKK